MTSAPVHPGGTGCLLGDRVPALADVEGLPSMPLQLISAASALLVPPALAPIWTYKIPGNNVHTCTMCG